MDKMFSGKIIIFLLAAISVPLMFSGCISTPVAPCRPAAMPALRVDDAAAAKRKAAFRQAVKQSPVRGVIVYPGSWKEFTADDVVKRAASYNFNRIYFVISSEEELDSRLEDLLESSVKNAIAPYVVVRQRDYFNRYRGNAFVRLFLKRYPDAVEVCRQASELITPYKGTVVMLIEPHRFTSAEQRRGGIDSCFIWGDFNFGIGMDNDMLMKKSLSDAAEAGKKSAQFIPAIADFYHEWAASGKLSAGKIDEVAKLAGGKPEVLLISTGNKPSAMAEGIKNEFAAAKCKIIPVFIVGDHLSEDTARFRRRNFSDFVRGIGYGHSQLSGKKAYGGFVTGPLRALEYMSYEKE